MEVSVAFLKERIENLEAGAQHFMQQAYQMQGAAGILREMLAVAEAEEREGLTKEDLEAMIPGLQVQGIEHRDADGNLVAYEDLTKEGDNEAEV